MSFRTFLRIPLAALLLIICAFFTRGLFPVPFWGVGICLVVMTAATLVSLIVRRRHFGEEYISAKATSSFRMYDAMQLFTKMAFYMAILCFFNSVLLDGNVGALDTVFYLSLNVMSVLVAVILVYFLFGKKVAERFDRTNVFVLGAAIWMIASICMFYKVFDITAVGYIFVCLGIGLMLSALRLITDDIKEAMSLVVNIDGDSFARFNAYSDVKAFFYAEIDIIALMLLFSGRELVGFFSDAVLIVPGVFLILACVFAVLQPLDKRNLDKIVIYRTAEGEEKQKQIIKNSLAARLTEEKDKAGIRIMTWFVRPFFRSKCVGKEKLKNLGGPVVFVANHYEIYGPIIAVLRMPVRFRPWIISNMLSSEQIEAQMRPGVDGVRWLPGFIKRGLPRVIKNFILYIMKAMKPIPVYRGNLREVIATIDMTAQAMMEGDNVMLFPEKPAEKYRHGGVDRFHSGFAEIGSAYYKKTGKSTTFYPVYISKKKRKMYIGDGIKFDPTAPKPEEKRRISDALYRAMASMAADAGAPDAADGGEGD